MVKSMEVAFVCRDVGRPLPLAAEYTPLDELTAELLDGVTWAQSRSAVPRTGLICSSISTRSLRPDGAVSKLLALWRWYSSSMLLDLDGREPVVE